MLFKLLNLMKLYFVKTPFQVSIQTKLGLLLVFVTTLIFSGFAVYNYISLRSAMQTELNHSSEFWAGQLSKSLAGSVWNYDIRLVKGIIKSAMLEKQIYAAVAKDSSGKVMYGGMRDSNWNIIEIRKEPKELSENEWQRKADITYAENKIGTVEICLSPLFMQKKLRDETLKMFIAFGILNIALICSLYIGVSKTIVFPVNLITDSIRKRTEQIFLSCGQVTSASQILAEGNYRQAAASQEISSSLEEVSAMIRRNAENAGHAERLMKEVMQIIEKANESVNRLTDSMEKIIKTSKETSGLVRTIDEIAFQTNLLALNAAVEAARAGEAGGGFAIVADEVRNLAMRTAQAARNTSDLIEGTLKRIQTGEDITSETSESFKEVTTYASKIGTLITEISGTSDEQALRIGHTNHAAADTDQITQNNAASAEETASASEDMKAQVEEIKILVNELAVLIGKRV